MQEVTKTAYNFVETIVSAKNGKNHFLFIDRLNALAMKKTLSKMLPNRIIKLKKDYCRIHPEYIEDFIGTYQTGFGNTDYLNNYVVYSVRIY